MNESPHKRIEKGDPVLPQVKVTKIFVIRFRSDDIKKGYTNIKKIVSDIKKAIQSL